MSTAEPTPRLRLLADGLWQTGDLLPLPGRVRMPVNSTVVRLPDGGLLVHSPLAFDDALAAEIDALGPVRHLVAPNNLHHLFLGAASRRWPEARVYAASGLRKKRPDLRIDDDLATDASPWDGVDLTVVTSAPAFGEVVLFHRPTSTMICADLVFHVTRPATLSTRLLLAMVGAGGGRLAQSRVWRFATRDRAAARAAADRILAWPIARVAVAHGEPYDAPDVRDALASALGRMTRARLALPAPMVATPSRR